MWSHPDLSKEERAKIEYKVDRLRKRVPDALDDAIHILERLAPEWIDNK